MNSLLRALISLAALMGFGMSVPAFAQLSFTLTTGSNSASLQEVVIDSNQCPTNGPSAAFTGGLVTNSGATTATNVQVSLSGLSNGFALGGGQAASQLIGAIAPGQSVAVFWQVGYGCVDQTTSSVTVAMTSSAGSSSRNYSLRTQQSKSANAGGQVTSTTLGPGAVVGQIIEMDVTYDFGGNSTGDEFLIQPSGSTAFNAGCFRLVGSQVTSSNISSIVVGTTNRLYFVQSNSQAGNGYFASMKYFFQYLCDGTSTVARPYAAQTSGTQLKYTGNFDGSGSQTISYPGATNPFTISKTATPDALVAFGSMQVTYTVTVSNPSAYDSYISSITDILPAGATFGAIAAGSGVTAANSGSIPANGATGTLTFQAIAGTSYFIAGGGSVDLIYTATLPSLAGSYANLAQANFGLASTPTATSTITVTNPTLNVTKVSATFADPVNGTSNPFSIPGATVEYVIVVTNPNPAGIASGAVIVGDQLPVQVKLVVTDLGGAGLGPIVYTDTDSNISYNFIALNSNTDDIEFSNDGGTTWTYSPSPDADGADANVTNFRVRPTGSLGSTQNLSIRYRCRIR